ncbi:MAG: ABC transporter permease subunit [Fuerstiella sp.]|nr:ABC transporter permease subunit [Fuerstiella sp.]
MRPFLAILRYESTSLFASWLVRTWLIATGLLAFVVMSANWGRLQTASLIAAMLFPYIVFPWSLVVMMLSVNPVSGVRIDAVADGILSRPVTRYEYLLASWSSRVLLVLGVYLLVMVPSILIVSFADRPAPDDTVTVYGTVCSVGVVGLVLTFLVSTGFLLGTLFRNQLLAIVVLAFLWFPINLVLNTFSLEEFSPISLNQALPTVLRQPWTEDAVDSEEANLQEAARQVGAVLDFFGGESGEPVEPPGFFEREGFDDFSLVRVVLGYGIPTFAAVVLATIVFCRRDL